MVERLLRDGYEVVGFDPIEEAVTTAEQNGTKFADFIARLLILGGVNGPTQWI